MNANHIYVQFENNSRKQKMIQSRTVGAPFTKKSSLIESGFLKGKQFFSLTFIVLQSFGYICKKI